MVAEEMERKTVWSRFFFSSPFISQSEQRGSGCNVHYRARDGEGRKEGSILILPPPAPTFIISMNENTLGSLQFLFTQSLVPSLVLVNPGNSSVHMKLLHVERSSPAQQLLDDASVICLCCSVYMKLTPMSIHLKRDSPAVTSLKG